MRAAIVVAWAALSACGRLDFDPRPSGDAAPAGDAAIAPLTLWGDYTATLPVGPCTGTQLLVNDSTWDDDGGTTITDPSQAGPTLSLNEALWIAKNTAGPNAIMFDSTVFPASAPATITVTSDTAASLQNVCIDGRSRGVVVDWSGCPSGMCPPTVNVGMIVGMTWLNMPYELTTQSVQIAGMRLQTDGFQLFTGMRDWTLEADAGTEVGPGNVIAGFYAMRSLSNGTNDIHDNGLGYDLVTKQIVPLAYGFAGDTFSTAVTTVERNVIVAAMSAAFIETLGPTTFSNNWIGVDASGTPQPGATGFADLISGTTILDHNVIEGVPHAVEMGGSNPVVTISQNSITANTTGITWFTAPVAPPVITVGGPALMVGNCTSGTIELFADPGDEGATFLGSAPCNGGVFMLNGTFPSGQNATATETVAGGTSAFSAPVAIP